MSTADLKAGRHRGGLGAGPDKLVIVPGSDLDTRCNWVLIR